MKTSSKATLLLQAMLARGSGLGRAPTSRGCRTNVRQLILYIQHKTPSFEKPGVRGIISLCN